jgi:hypothetical protein
MTCFACEKEPTQQCPRCGRPYCDEHGEELCDVCLHPASGMPSFSLYRGSLLALLIGTALAVWLLVQPNSTSGANTLRPVVITPTAGAAVRPGTTPGAAGVAGTPGAAVGTPAPAGGVTTPGAVATRPAGTAVAGTTPGAGPTPAPGATSGTGDVVVASGDTLSDICARVKPNAMSVSDCVDQVVQLNNLSSPSSISVGDKLKVPSR